MKFILYAALLFSPALQAAEPPAQRREPPELRAQLAKEAASLLEQIKTSPADPELHIKLGFTYTRLEQADDALQAFETAVRLDPKKAVAHYMLGLIYEKKGLREKALAAWKACLENTDDPRLRDTAIRHIHHITAVR